MDKSTNLEASQRRSGIYLSSPKDGLLGAVQHLHEAKPYHIANLESWGCGPHPRDASAVGKYPVFSSLRRIGWTHCPSVAYRCDVDYFTEAFVTSPPCASMSHDAEEIPHPKPSLKQHLPIRPGSDKCILVTEKP